MGKSQFGGEEKKPGQGVRLVGVWRDKLEWRARPDDPFPCFAHMGEMGRDEKPGPRVWMEERCWWVRLGRWAGGQP